MTTPTLQMSDEQFHRAVEQEVKNTHGGHHSPAVRKALGHSVELTDRWRAELLRIKHAQVAKIDRTSSRADKDALEHVRGLVAEIASVTSLVEFSDEDFQDVVDAENRRVGGKFLRSLLLSPALIERWRLSLAQMKRSVESQIGSRADDVLLLREESIHPELPSQDRDRAREEHGLDTDAVRCLRERRFNEAHMDFIGWRAGAKRFKLGVDERLAEIQRERLAKGMFEASEHALAMDYIQRLVAGIEAHRAAVTDEFEPQDISEADRTLWKIIPERS